LLLEIVRAAVGGALVEGAVGTLFPAVEGAVAVRAPVRSFRRAIRAGKRGQAATDFAAQLAGLAAIVAVEELGGSAAVGAMRGGRQGLGTAPANRRERPTMVSLVLGAQLLPVQGRRGRGDGGWLSQGSQRVDGEVAIVGMLLAKVVAGLRFGLSSGENLLQLLDEFLQVLASKFPTKPNDQSWYAAHGGESLGNLAGSLQEGFGKRDFTAFLIPCQLPPWKFQPECTQPSRRLREPRLPTPARGRKQKCRLLPRIEQNIGLIEETF
jgi:hypothetical protein